jgi:FtsH-binding integral membrane protein
MSHYHKNSTNDDFLELGEHFQGRVHDFQNEMRLGFIRKVYGILTMQLSITVVFCIASVTSMAFQKFQQNNLFLFFTCIVLACLLPCVIVCCESVMRKTPNNYIILFTFTFAESYLVSFVCGNTNPEIVLMAAVMTCAMVSALTLYACTTKTDITTQGGAIFLLGCAFLMFGFFLIFTNNKILHIVYCVLGIILFGWYLLYDTQLIMGNKQNSFDFDDYILASFQLYTDIINLFLKTLELIQLLTGNRSE